MAFHEKKNAKVRETCILCEREEEKGIHIMEAFLCKMCERELVELEPEDPEYKERIKKLRKIRASKLLS